MPARAQGGKGRDRLARCSLSGLQYCVAIRDKLLGNSRARTHCITRCAIFLHYRHWRGPPVTIGFALGPQVSQRFGA